jgi:hypothetical protein
MTLAQIEFTAIRVKEEGEFVNDYELLTCEEVGISERTLVSPGVTNITGRNCDNKFVTLATIQEPLTDSDTFSLDFYGHYDLIETLTKFKQKNSKFYVQLMYFPQQPVDVPSLATKIEHYLVQDTGLTLGAGRNRDGSGGLQENSISLAATNRVIANLGISLTSVTNSLTENALSMVMVTDDLARDTGYRGPDKVIFVGLDDDAANPGTVAVSVDGGSSFAELTTDPDPFAGIVGNSVLEYFIINETQFRVVAGATLLVGTKAQFAYQDFTFGSETVAAAWTVVSIAATATGDGIDTSLWPEASRLYLSSAGEIYVSTDLGESDPGAAKFTGANVFNDMFYDSDRNVWAVGAADAIIVEEASARDTWVTRVAPSTGPAAFGAIAVADNGIIFAGYGSEVYSSTNGARTAAGWSSLKDFGGTYTVQKIVCVEGSSEIVYVFVDDNGVQGDVWFTTNGGVTWTQKTATVNSGYKDAVISEQDPNLMFAVGNIQGSNPIIDRLS